MTSIYMYLLSKCYASFISGIVPAFKEPEIMTILINIPARLFQVFVKLKITTSDWLNRMV